MDFCFFKEGEKGMAVNLFGNINGRSYNPPTVDLFEMSREQNNQRISINETRVDKECMQVKVDISQEGLRALHGSKLKGSMNIDDVTNEIKYISEHQPIESFTNRFSQVMANDYLQLKGSGTSVAEEKGNSLLSSFRNICDKIVSGYAEGNRIRYIEDDTSEDGFVKISKSEELSILLEEFSLFVENRFGKQYQEEAKKLADATNDIQNTKQKLGIGTNEYYEPIQMPSGFVERLLNEARQYMDLL